MQTPNPSPALDEIPDLPTREELVEQLRTAHRRIFKLNNKTNALLQALVKLLTRNAKDPLPRGYVRTVWEEEAARAKLSRDPGAADTYAGQPAAIIAEGGGVRLLVLRGARPSTLARPQSTDTEPTTPARLVDRSPEYDQSAEVVP